MNVLVSPYHLTTREPAAMAALALARNVVTVVPGTDAGDARSLPAFSRFVKSWAWSVPFWKAGVLKDSHGGCTPGADIWDATRHIDQDAQYGSLRHFLLRHEHEDERAYLTALANDLMKGGPDPGLSLPVAAGLDRFAARTGCLVARGAPTSLAQRAEASVTTPVFSIVVPVFVQATAQRILHYREVLDDQIARLGAAVERAANAAEGCNDSAALVRDVQSAAAALARAFEESREELFVGSPDDEVRPVEGAVSLSAVRLPWDAVLTSSVRALQHLAPVPDTRSGPSVGTMAGVATSTTTLPATRDPLAGKSLISLIVRPMGQSNGRH